MMMVGSTGVASAAGSKPYEGGSVTLDFTQDIAHLDPAVAYDTQSNEIVAQLYDQLVTWQQGGGEKVVPMAAKSWTVSKNGLVYTFNLRKGMTFWNGDAVTAQSFIDEIDRVMTPSVNSPGSGFYTIIKGASAYMAGKAKTITGLSAPNPYTLKITLNTPEAFFLETLTLPFISAVDQKYINSVGNKVFDTQKAMGSGPFELSSINQNQIVLTKNPHYWRTDSYGQKLPYLNKITINVNSNSQLDALHFLQGQTAWIGWNFGGDGVPSSNYIQIIHDRALQNDLLHFTEASVQYVGLNTTVGPTKNPLVRQAIEYAINKQRIIQLNNGRGIIANQPLPPMIPGYVKNMPKDASYSYNPAKAKALLKKAGYSKGFTVDFYSSNTPDQLKFDNEVQANLAAIGIKANIKASSWGTFLNVAMAGKAPTDWLGWFQDFPDASDFLNTLFNSNQIPANNNWNYNNPLVDKWLNKAQTDNNQAQRVAIYKKTTIQIMKDAVWVPVYYDQATFAHQSWVHDFYSPSVGQDPLEWIWVSPGH